jgi:hypothetical protein
MIEMRMVADDHGYMQLQSRGFCVQRGWTEWRSVPIVHDPAQLVDRIEIFDAKSSGTKPDGGLTGAQVTKILGELERTLDKHRDTRHRGLVAGISHCLSVIRSELSPQPAEPEIDL